MEYQPPSFQLSDEFQNGMEETVIRPLSPANRGIRPSPKDTKSRRGTPLPSNQNAIHSATRGKESLLDAGLSASEMLRQLRKEKEELLRMQIQSADAAGMNATDAPVADSINPVDATDASGKDIDVTDENDASIGTFCINVPPPPPNPPPRHKQTVMALYIYHPDSVRPQPWR